MSRLRAVLERIDERGIRLGLGPMQRLLVALGSPQEALRVVLVAGTNGKGSCAATLAAILSRAGYRTGLYTSPHLEEPRERIRLDGVAIGEDQLADLLEEVLGAPIEGERPQPTYFEALTAAGLLHYQRVAVDVAVLEVGLGGRLDATNTTAPLLSVVTEIALDHCDQLGTTTAAVAKEKAGIFRPGGVAVAWCHNADAAAALVAEAARIGAVLEPATHTCGRQPGERPATWQISTPEGRYTIEPGIAGSYAVDNQTLAIRAAEHLRRCGFDRLSPPAIVAGCRDVRWPGRLERLALAGHQVLLDGAHNPAGVAALVAELVAIAQPFDLLCGALVDRPLDLLRPLAAAAQSVVVTTPATSRGRPADEVAAALGRPARIEPVMDGAISAWLAGEAALKVAAGSLILVGETRIHLRRRFGAPPPAAATSTLVELPQAADS